LILLIYQVKRYNPLLGSNPLLRVRCFNILQNS
jgi:hypothetical protein